MDTKLKNFNWLRFSVTSAVLVAWTLFATTLGISWTKLQTKQQTGIFLVFDGYVLYEFAGFFTAMFAVVMTAVFVSGFVLALFPKLGIGRGFWGNLPIELMGFAMIAVPTSALVLLGEVVYLLKCYGRDLFCRLLFVPYQWADFFSMITILGMVWFVLFVVFEAAASLGAGIRDGFLQYLLRKSIVIRLCAKVMRKTKNLCAKIARVDFTKPIESNLLKWLTLNALLVSVLCLGWFVGIFGVVIYSVVLFYLLRKYLHKLQNQYSVLVDSATKMAQGNLNRFVEQDLGMFNELRDKMNTIQSGFANAVEQEVRSRNMKTELITNVSHDLKTPLTAIITYVDLLKNPELSKEEQQNYIDTLDRKSQRLKHLIEDLFEVSKAATGNVTMNKEPLDLAALLRQVQYETEDSTKTSGVDFRWSIPEQRICVELDGQRSCRIFENLVNNINKYAMKGTRAYISLEQKEHLAVVSFKNVSAQELSSNGIHLTERFVRGDSSRSTEGSGLGLAIAKSFTELQNGTFVLETEGDLFKVWVSFPIQEPPTPL